MGNPLMKFSPFPDLIAALISIHDARVCQGSSDVVHHIDPWKKINEKTNFKLIFQFSNQKCLFLVFVQIFLIF